MFSLFRLIGLTLAMGYLVYASSASGQSASDAGSTGAESVSPRAVQYGIGIHARGLMMPEWTIKLVNRDWVAVQGMKNLGVGIDFVRRSRIGEVALGLGYERLGAEDGLWLDDGGQLSPTGCCPDLVEFDNFAWISADLTVAGLKDLSADRLALRYGAGVGMGIMQGDVLRTRYLCPEGRLDLNECHIHDDPRGRVRQPKDGIPPVVPLFNVFVGLQLRPASHIAVNFDTGIRWAFYSNVSVIYLLGR